MFGGARASSGPRLRQIAGSEALPPLNPEMEIPYLSANSDGSVMIRVYVQPKASRNSVVGIHDGCLKIAVTSPPVEGKANSAVAGYLAKLLGVAKRDISLSSGQSSRRKVFQVSGKTMEELRVHIASILAA